MANIITVYSVYSTTDERGSRGGRKGTYRSRFEAEHAAKGIGWWGGNGDISTGFAIEVDGAFYLLVDAEPLDLDDIKAKIEADIRAAALNKLTPEEKALLGLKDE